VLTQVGSEAPEIHRRFSIETPSQWSEFLQMTNRQRRTYDVCIEHHFLTDERLTLLKEQGSSVYTWTVDRRDVAQALIERGVSGIISNSLQLLSSIAGARA
jgi:glycerophosphoryl diester phosphodiesterase